MVKKIFLFCSALLFCTACSEQNNFNINSTEEVKRDVLTSETPFDPPVVYPLKPFEGRDVSHIDIRCKYDLYDPMELSAEDMEDLTEMLKRVEIADEKMDVRKLIPYSGNAPASFTIFFDDGEKTNFSAESGIVYPDGTDGGVYIMDGDYYAVDRETVREITDFYHDILLDKYFPEYSASYAPDPHDSDSIESREPIESDYEFVPFVDTNAANLAYIEIVLDGLDAYREDGTFVEPERLSEEETAAVFELLQQISIDTPPLSRDTWAGTPDGGYGSVFNVYYYANSLGGEASCIQVIPYPVHLPDKTLSGGIIFNSMCFPIDYELYSQLCSCYHELYKKYYPDLYAKWYPTTDEA